MIHQPVLLQEVLKGLAVKPGETVVDATVNRGGHSVELCRALGPSGHLIAFDADANALAAAKSNLTGCSCSVDLVNSNFVNLRSELETRGVKSIDAILFDLGLSSEQLAGSGRGFSFQTDEPLYMTLETTPSEGRLTAAEIVNSWSEGEIAKVLSEYGEEQFAKRIALAIVQARKSQDIVTTGELVAVIKQAVPTWYQNRRIHFATKTFQALRMATNDELQVLLSTLTQAWQILNPNGRLAVISFHSLEARLVKQFFQAQVKEGVGELITKHAIKPAYTEVRENPRARSAQLRIIKKI